MQGLPVGWAEGLVQGAEGYLRGDEPNTLMALEIAISPDHTGQGISYTMLNAIRVHAKGSRFQALIVAVRPSPEVTLSDYTDGTILPLAAGRRVAV
ncbi:MAG: hypothetical protein R3C44_19065 [Chloroflexota bacterium]